MPPTRSTQALAPRLVFPETALARPPPDGPADHLLKASVRGEDIVLTLAYPLIESPEPDFESDLLQLLVNDSLVGDPIELKHYDMGDIIEIPLRAIDRPLDASDDRHLVSINYRVFYNSGAGRPEDGPGDQAFFTDIVRPGRDSLAPPVFDPAVVANGVTPDTLVDDGAGGAYLPATIKGYADARSGDDIVGWIDDTIPTPAMTIDATQVGTDVELRFPRELLEQVDRGTFPFSYRITDRAGNVSIGATAVDLRIRLTDLIDDLQPPRVPAADDGLVDDADARSTGGVHVDIPGNTQYEAGDRIVVQWQAFTPPAASVGPGDLGKDPVHTFVVPYDAVYDAWGATSAETDLAVDTEVTYRVLRGDGPASEPALPTVVAVNLFVPGGKDPDPETPEHENLLGPRIRGATTEADNLILPGDLEYDAVATIPGMNGATPAAPSFASGDVLQLFWDGSIASIAYTVSANEVGLDILLDVPADVMKAQGSGLKPVYYTATRRVDGAPGHPGENIASSRVQPVDVVTVDELPGGKDGLAEGLFTEANKYNAIGFAEATSDGGTPLRIAAYVNQREGDTIVLRFVQYDSKTGAGPPLEATRYISPPHTISADELGSPIDIIVPTDKLIVPDTQGNSATATYTIRTPSGIVVEAREQFVLVDVRG